MLWLADDKVKSDLLNLIATSLKRHSNDDGGGVEEGVRFKRSLRQKKDLKQDRTEPPARKFKTQHNNISDRSVATRTKNVDLGRKKNRNNSQKVNVRQQRRLRQQQPRLQRHENVENISQSVQNQDQLLQFGDGGGGGGSVGVQEWENLFKEMENV